MLVGAKWYDPVIGIDIHIIQPPGPVPPVPVPHPFIGIVFDPLGMAVGMAIGAAISGIFGGPFSGPVFINGMPAANTGTEVKGMPVHIPIGGTFVNPPSNEGTIITGSKTVNIMGTSAARLTSMVMTCNDPMPLPTSLVMAIPMGPPVFIGGPTGIDLLAALMRGIRCKWISDKLHALFKAKPGSWRSRIICFLTGHPVDVATGRVLTDHVDFELPGPIPFKFERNYYSASTYNGPLGHGWHHSYDQHITIRDDAIFLRSEDGREIEFDYIEEGETLFEPVERLDLERYRDHFIVRTADRRILHFGPGRRSDGTWPLRRIEDLNGNAITLDYDGDRLVTIIDSAGRRLKLVNDVLGRLLALEAPHPDGLPEHLAVARFEYDTAGDLVAAYDALGHAYRYAYKNHLLVKETNRNGLSFYFEYDAYEPDGWCTHTWGDGGIYHHNLTYHKQAHITIVENSLGAKTTYICNSFGLVNKVIDALGGVTTYEWDGCCRKVAETDANGSTQRWEYDEKGNTIRIADSLGPVGGGTFNHLNLPVELIDDDGNHWHREYDDHGNWILSQDAAGSRWFYDYDQRGNLLRQTDPVGGVTRFEWDSRGQVTRITTPLGVTKQFVYDALGRLTTIVHQAGSHTRYQYDVAGRLLCILRPDGALIRHQFDPEGNLVKVIQPDQLETRLTYQGYNQLAQHTNADGHTEQIVYDTESNVIAVHNQRGEVYLAERDPVGRVVREQYFDGHEIKYRYDAVGHVIAQSDSLGRTTRFERDARGRLLRQRRPDGTEIRFVYDAMGRVREAHARHSDVFFTYDNAGRLVSESQNGMVISYDYDALGRRAHRRSPVGSSVTYNYNVDGQLSDVRTAAGALSIDYDQRGYPRTIRLPADVEESRTYDARGRLAHQVLQRMGRTILARTYRYDLRGNLVEFADNAKGTKRFHYDSLERLKTVESDGILEEFVFDQTGNLLRRGIKNLAYSAGDRLLRQDQIVYRHDAMGNLVEKKLGDMITQYRFDSDGQLVAVELPDKGPVEFSYDALGRRIAKRSADAELTYIWDGETVLLEQKGNQATEFVFQPEGFELLAQLRASAFHVSIGDHLGTPWELLDTTGQISWSAHYDVYGSVSKLEKHKSDNLCRFLGQIEDPETGLHYNRFRYYDPEVGRYLTPDPLGIYVGLNYYRYAPNPLRWVDPLGLASCQWNRGIEIRGGQWRIRILHLAPGGRFDILALRRAGQNFLRAEVHPISQRLPQWLRLPHVHLDFLGPRWAHTHLPWEIRPQGLNDFLRRIGL